ncbi:MAG: hypothetical protein HZB63_05530 [Deltaproteobacteria bacterium]|nr:hypothetical protein [Deltaproteobacteria bacterium]
MADIPVATSYIESFDSVRYDGEASFSEENYIRTELELLVSLLFGQPIILSEPMSFDSAAFLCIASDILDARGKVLGNKKSSELNLMKCSPVMHPFLLAKRGQESFLKRMAGYVKNKTFVCSAWEIIPKDRDVAAALLEKGYLGEFEERFENANGTQKFTNFDEQVECLVRVANYFDEIDRIGGNLRRNADFPIAFLEKYLQWFLKYNPGDIGKDEDIAGKLRATQKALSGALKKGISDKNRSDIRNRRDEVDVDTDRNRDEIVKALFDLYDSSYNAVVSDSVRASTRILSSAQPGKLSSVFDPICTKAYEHMKDQNDHVKADDETGIGEALLEIKKTNTVTNSLSQRSDWKGMRINYWEKVWEEILLDQKWIESAGSFHRSRITAQGEEIPRGPFESHVQFISAVLPRIMTKEPRMGKEIRLYGHKLSNPLVVAAVRIGITHTFEFGVDVDPFLETVESIDSPHTRLGAFNSWLPAYLHKKKEKDFAGVIYRDLLGAASLKKRGQ